MPDIDLRIVEPITWLMSKAKRIKIAVGGRSSGKSTGIGQGMIVYADQGQRICCAREYQNSIDDSVHENLKREIARLNIEGFDVRAKDIFTHSGGEIMYKGLARNITSLKSIAGVNKLWIEEGESVGANSLKILTPSIRSGADDEEPPEIWISMNRQSREGAIAKKYLSRAESELSRCGRYEDDLMMVVQVNYKDNPWFPADMEQERRDDELNLDPDEYAHIWGGEYNESVENSIIKRKWFDAAIDAHIKLGIDPVGAVVAAHDPADEGPDPKGFSCRKGILYTEIDELKGRDGNEACDEATERAIKANADLFVWDGDGMGALLRRQIARSFSGIKCELRMYKGSNAVEDKKAKYDGLDSLGMKDRNKTNGEMFFNKRTQFYMKLAKRFENTYKAVIQKKHINPDEIISISSSIRLINKVRSEVCRIPRKPNGAGKIQIMSKKEMKDKYKIDSPNMADCLAMGEEQPELADDDFDDEFEGW